MPSQTRTSKKAKELAGLLRGKKSMLIVMQDNPDPDAVAAAGALRQIAKGTSGVVCSLAHGGAVGRVENRALVRYLSLNLRPIGDVRAEQFDLVSMVDTQPQTGNNSLPPDIKVNAVFDHHPLRKESRSADFTDVRKAYGATSTILYEYLREFKIEVDTTLATALCYGIRSDTQELGRDSTQADIDAYVALYPLANKRALGRIQREPEPVAYYRTLSRGLTRARTYDRALVTPLGNLDCPESAAEMADLLLRCETVDWALTYGIHNGRMYLSLRTNVRGTDAGKTMASIVRGLGRGGGHESAAGGQIDVAGLDAGERQELDETLLERFLKRLDIPDRKGKSLLARGQQNG